MCINLEAVLLGLLLRFSGVSVCKSLSLCYICVLIPYPANTKHLYIIRTMLVQRRRRWTDVVQMLYKCFVLVGIQY